jgi:hypothetical protein
MVCISLVNSAYSGTVTPERRPSRMFHTHMSKLFQQELGSESATKLSHPHAIIATYFLCAHQARPTDQLIWTRCAIEYGCFSEPARLGEQVEQSENCPGETSFSAGKRAQSQPTVADFTIRTTPCSQPLPYRT